MSEQDSDLQDAPADEPTGAPLEEEAPGSTADELKQPRNTLGLLAILLSLGSIAGLGYLYYALIHTAPVATLESRVQGLAASGDGLRGALERTESDVARLQTQLSSELDALADEQARRLEENEASVLRTLADFRDQTPPAESEWKIAEAEYLLRVANHRLLLERDSRTALTLLRATDQILEELDDFALHVARAQLADEILALEGTRDLDTQGIFLRLEAAKNQIPELPIGLPEYLERPDREPLPEELSFWQRRYAELMSLFEFRRVDAGTLQRIPTPDETVYLERSLRLALETAQLALLRRHQTVYQQSLDNAQRWSEEYLAADSSAVQAFVDEIAALQALDVDQPLPDVSGSLRALLDIRRGRTSTVDRE